jgi:hypothetical protein
MRRTAAALISSSGRVETAPESPKPGRRALNRLIDWSRKVGTVLDPIGPQCPKRSHFVLRTQGNRDHYSY